MADSQASQRKDEHLELAGRFFADERSNDFDHVHLVRPTLPESAVLPGSIATDFFGQPVSAPFFINAMTGGSRKTASVNRDLATVAAREKIGMALGSASIVESQPDLIDTFAVAREVNPDGPLLINVNPTTSIETVDFLATRLNPVAVQVHVNAVQELVMPEGDRDFHWLARIKWLNDTIECPVIVKEVGFGFDVSSLEKLAIAGIRYVDVAGSGGTDFTQIENSRRALQDFAYLRGVGLSTVRSLLNARYSDMTVIASGGVRNPLDVLKSLALGARYVGVSNGFLQVLRRRGAAGLVEHIEVWKAHLAGLVALFGAASLEETGGINYYLDADLAEYERQRHEMLH